MIPATPKNIDEIDSFIENSITNMEQGNDIILTILDNVTIEFLGVCGLHGRPNPTEPMLGIWLKKSAHGNHYGQEAIRHLADWARNNIVFSNMVYPCDKDNIARRKVAEHLGALVVDDEALVGAEAADLAATKATAHLATGTATATGTIGVFLAELHG